jgi:hypothetical protein
MMVRKPTRRGIRRHTRRNRVGGTVYQNDDALDSVFGEALADQPAIGTPAQAYCLTTGTDQLRPIDVVQALIELLDRSGWKRLEVCRSVPGSSQVNGYCVDAEGNHLHVADLL